LRLDCGSGNITIYDDKSCLNAISGPASCSLGYTFAICTQPQCGNGIQEVGEQCENGLDNNNYGDCKENCTVNVCGDGWLNRDSKFPEQCDDNNTVDNDGCASNCLLETCNGSPCPVCGDGRKNGVEECDDGNKVTGDGCNNCMLECKCAISQTQCFYGTPNNCTNSACQLGSCLYNSNINCLTTSTCNLGTCSPLKCTNDPSRSCSSDFQCSNFCGGGDVCTLTGNDCTANEDCLQGQCRGVCSGNTSVSCSGTCDFGTCFRFCTSPFGNRQCTSDLSCSSGPCGCAPVCSNNITETGETCDDGNIFSGDGCSSTCQLEAVCGNGILEINEVCDDNNIFPGDGCSSTCLCEQPNVTLVKTANISHFSYAGEVVLYTYSITGSFALSNISLVDDRCSPITCAVLDASHAVCECVYNVQAADLGTNVINHANATASNGLEQCSQTNSDIDTETVVYDKVCGNGYLDAGETCDDGNTRGGDGCNSNCQCEPPSPPQISNIRVGTYCDRTNVVRFTVVVQAYELWAPIQAAECVGPTTYCNSTFPTLGPVECYCFGSILDQFQFRATVQSGAPCSILSSNVAFGSSTKLLCDDGQFCNGLETCVFDTSAGDAHCLPGTPPSCDDGVNCTQNLCNATTNVCEPRANNTLCNTNNPCRTDLCRAKTCQGGPRNGRTCATNADCPTTLNCTAVPAPAGCYQIYNPRGNCALTQGYWKNHYVPDFTSAVNRTYDNYICYTPPAGKKAAIDPLYWFNQPVRGSTWIPLAYQYYAAVANLNSYLTNHCCSPHCSAADYFSSPEVCACFLFAQEALKTAFTSCTVNNSIPLCCKLAPAFNASISLVHANKCQIILDRFNNGNAGIVPHCSDPEFNMLGIVSPPPLPPPPSSSSTPAMDEDTEHHNIDAESDTPSAGVQTIYLVVFAAGFVVLLGLTAALSAAIR